jgi:Ca-activated chloride channel homolog
LRSPYPQNGRIEIAGVLTERSTHLRLDLLHPGGERATIEVPLRAGEAPFNLAAPLWARLKIESLEAQYELNRGEIRRLGQNFRLVTRETSLIVLDRVEDYARYEIAPPPELMADYEKLRQIAARRNSAERGSHLENIVRRFGDKVAWWNKDFPQDLTSSSRDLQIAAPRGDNIQGFNSQMQIEQQARRNTVASERPPVMAPEVMLAPPRPGNAPMATIGIRGTAGGAPDDATEARVRVAPPPPVSPLPMPQQNAIARLGIAANNVESKKALAEPGETAAVIQLKKWEPDAAYASRLHAAASDTAYRIYLDERPRYLASTAFFLDVADILFDKGQPALAQRVLSNLAEMDLENRQILRVLGYRLLQAQKPALAIPVFRKVLELSPAEPQSYRDLGLALAANGQYQEAVDTLYEVVIRPWDNRFPDIELTALAEMNAIIATHGPLDVSRFDSRLSKNLPLDLRVVLTWDADNTDIDLWVTDPNGEKAFYSHPLTYQGGRMSADFTGGYGPEEFSLKHAKPGKYKVEAQYFADNRQIVMGATTLQVRLATKFGSDRQKEKSITLRLKDRKESIFVGEFEVK